MANRFDMGKVEKQVRTQLEASLVLMGRTAKTFFYDNFRKQGFDDKNVTKWKPRKDQSRNSIGRAVLVKSGDIRRSIRFDTVNKANLSVRIASDLPYAKIHNDGLTGRAWGKAPFKMPKRQFIGDSWNLNEKVKKILITNIDKGFKQ